MSNGSNHAIPIRFHIWIWLPLILLIMNVAAGFNGLYGQDSFEYLRYSRELHLYLTDGSLPGVFHWPILYPLAGAMISFLIPDILALQVVSIISYGMMLLYLKRILIQLYPERKREAIIYLLLFFSVSPFVLRYASSVMSEILCMFFLAAFLYYYLLFRKSGIKSKFLLMVLFASAAINTRYASGIIVLIPLIHAVLLFMKKFNLGFFVLALMVPVIVFLPGIFLEIQGSQAMSGPAVLPEWSILNYFRNDFHSSDGHLSYFLPNIIYVFKDLVHPGFIFAGILFLFFLRRQDIQRPFMAMTFCIVIVYALFIAGLPYQNDRILILSFPFVFILFSASFFRTWDYIKIRIRIPSLLLILAVLIIQAGLSYRAYRPFYKNSLLIREIAAHIKAYPDATIYTFNIDQGLKAYDVRNEIVNLWSERIENFKTGSIVLINYDSTDSQWQNMNPVYNLEKLNNDHDLVMLESFPDNWKLYEIKN